MTSTLLLGVLIFIAALLYSSVGHGGASGYLAAMALFDLAPDVMKPTALVLNLFVTCVGTVRYARAGCFSWNIFWPFAVLSIPFAFLGGMWRLPAGTYKIILGLVLLFAAWRLAIKQSAHAPATQKAIVLPAALALGAAIGLLSGLTGVGGGIFLSPLLLLLGWAEVRKTAGVSAAFILVNSAAGAGRADRRGVGGGVRQSPAHAADDAAHAGCRARGCGAENAPGAMIVAL